MAGLECHGSGRPSLCALASCAATSLNFRCRCLPRSTPLCAPPSAAWHVPALQKTLWRGFIEKGTFDSSLEAAHQFKELVRGGTGGANNAGTGEREKGEIQVRPMRLEPLCDRVGAGGAALTPLAGGVLLVPGRLQAMERLSAEPARGHHHRTGTAEAEWGALLG